MDFAECVRHCLETRELVEQFNRLWGTHLDQDSRTPIERAIDVATGYQAQLDEAEREAFWQFVAFVYEYVWLPMVADEGEKK